MNAKSKSTAVKKHILYKILFCVGFFCMALVPFYYYCKYQTVEWLKQTGFDVQAEYVYPTFEGFRPGLKISKLEVKSKHPEASLKKISANSIIVRPSLFSFMKLFSSYTFDFELQDTKINIHGQLYAEIVKGTGEVVYRSGVYYLNHFMAEPLKFELTPEYSTLEKGKLRKASTSYSIHLIHLKGSYSKGNKRFNLYLHVPKPINLTSKKEDYTLEAIGEGMFIRKKLKEEMRLPIVGNVKFNIVRFSNFLSHLREAQLISTIENNIGAVLGYPITKQKLSSNELEEIMTNAVSLNLKMSPEAAYIGLLKIYP